MTKPISHQMKIGIVCPNCKAPMRTRNSRGLTPTYRQLIYVCQDPECGGSYGAELTITHVISPSAKPNPDLQLRQSPPRRKRADNDDFPPASSTTTDGPGVPSLLPANDDREELAAIGALP